MASPARPEAGHNRAATGPNAITQQSGPQYQLVLASADNRRAANQSLSSVRPSAVLFRVRCGRLACAMPRPGRGSRNDLTPCKVVERVLHALAAKSAIAPILSTLLPARKHAINGSGVSYDAPRIVYVCVGPFLRRLQRTMPIRQLPNSSCSCPLVWRQHP
jgi:hypothetical protein